MEVHAPSWPHIANGRDEARPSVKLDITRLEETGQRRHQTNFYNNDKIQWYFDCECDEIQP